MVKEKALKRMASAGIAVVFLLGFAVPARAEVTLDDLLKRVEALERENSSLKAEVMALKEKQFAPAPLAQAVAPVAPSGNFLKTGPEVQLYGFIKADAVISSNDMGNVGASITQTNATRPTTAGVDDPEAQMSAQDTRLGLKFKAPDLEDGGKVSGQFEMDFGNSGANLSGNYTPRMRLAFVQMDFERWGVNAGQNWDMFAPLNTNILNPGALYRAGNLGTRHPQATLVKNWGDVLGGKLTTKIGAVDSDDPLQEDSGVPAATAYVGYEGKVLGVKSVAGIGGMYGKLNLPGKGIGNKSMYATTAGLTLTFTDWLAFKTEGFVGAGLNKFQGGPTQTAANSTSTTGARAIPVKGGFVELTFNPTKKIEMNLGVGIDDIREDSASFQAGDKSTVWDKNRSYYTNLKYSLSKELLAAIELQEFDTKWLDGLKAHDQRVETTLIYKF